MMYIDDIDPDKLSICTDCAKNISLQNFINRHAVKGVPCGVCRRAKTNYFCCDLLVKEKLSYLIRSLIRFYYDEDYYNPHFGGDFTPTSILYNDNPILENDNTLFHYRSSDNSEAFIESLFWPPYPDINKGVSVYAGFYDGIRVSQRSIQNELNHEIQKLQDRLRKENHFDIEPNLLDLLSKTSSRIQSNIPKGHKYCRARVGIEKRYVR